MTYCVAMHLADGLVFVSDSRTNAGIDHIATFRKLFTFGVPGERLIVLQSAGNLATSQSVVNLLKQRLGSTLVNLDSVPTLYDATALVAETIREVVARDGAPLAGNTDLTCSFLVGGQIAGQPPALYSIYPQGNFIQATEDTPSCNWARANTASPSSTATSPTAPAWKRPCVAPWCRSTPPSEATSPSACRWTSWSTTPTASSTRWATASPKTTSTTRASAAIGPPACTNCSANCHRRRRTTTSEAWPSQLITLLARSACPALPRPSSPA